MNNWMGWYLATVQECAVKYLNGVRDVVDWLESELTGGDDSGPGGTHGGFGGAGPSPTGGPEAYWTLELEIDNSTGKPVTLMCDEFRQVGGGVAITPDKIECIPNVVQPGKNAVEVRIDMFEQPVGIWSGYIMSTDDPKQQMTSEAIMPAWAH